MFHVMLLRLSLLLAPLCTASALPLIYRPGDVIPSGYVASTGIIRQMYFAGTTTPVAGTNYNLLGYNSPEFLFQRATDFAAASRIRFDGVLNHISSFAAGEPFLLGYLTYTNGLFFLSSYDFVFSAGIQVGPNMPPLPNGLRSDSYSGTIRLTVTSNVGTPEQNADIVYFFNESYMGSLRVYEDKEGTIEVWARLGSILLNNFGTVTSPAGSAFSTPTIDPLPGPYRPGQTGNGTFSPSTIVSPTGAVPEPGSMWLLLNGVAVVALRKRIHRN